MEQAPVSNEPPLHAHAGAAAPRFLDHSRGTIVAGLAVVGVFFVGFGGWAAMAPLSSAAIAPGVLSPDGSRRTIQHLEGGIIAEILVQNDDHVEVGQPLLVLDNTRADALNSVLLNQSYTNLAIQSRLLAELRGADEIEFPEVIQQALHYPEIRDVVATQSELFAARRDRYVTQKDILAARVRQLEEEISGLERQIEGQVQQLGYLDEQIADQESLFAEGFARKSPLLELKSRRAATEGDIGRNRAEIARARQAIGETRLQVEAVDSERLDSVNSQLTEIRVALAEVEERLRPSEDALSRTVIRAPVSGTIVNLRYRTVGGVIGAGQPVLDIVPGEEELLIDARLAPSDIDMVSPGLRTQVILSAFKQREIPRLEGVVRTVSADAMTDPLTGASYYEIRVEVPPDELAKLPRDAHLVPGMQAEVFIDTGRNTMLGYLMDPMTATFRRAAREH
jgi:HlyD family secretion protein/epimerase transport system membrane fusion protein